MQFHEDPAFREEVIRDYLRRALDADAAEAFESHYLSCDECFQELRVSGQIMIGLHQCRVEFRRVDDVLVLQFAWPTELTRQSPALGELQRASRQSDTKVLIDLSQVVKVDSAGLGQLLANYSHLASNRGTLKLLNPNPEIRALLRLTRIDSVIETYNDEHKALTSFGTGNAAPGKLPEPQ